MISTVYDTCTCCTGHVNSNPSSTDLARQYKTMQAQMEARIDLLESQVRKLQAELGKTGGWR